MKFSTTINKLLKRNDDKLNSLPYDLRYAKTGIYKIIGSLNKIEQDLVNDVSLTCLSFLETLGAKIENDSFVLKGERFKLYVESIKCERKLVILFYPLVKQNYSMIKEEREINEFGMIKALEITYPYLIRKNFTRLIEIINNQIVFAYLSLQKVFQTNFKSFGEYLFNELYNILNIEIDRQCQKHLRSKAYFNVTLRSTKKFRYFLDHENLEVIIDFFKKNQLLSYAPIEMLASLISEEAKDTLNILLDVQEGDFDHIKSTDFISQEENTKFWVSESLLVDSKELSSYTITKTDKLIFQISCPKELEKEFKKIFKIVKSPLDEKFRDNLKKYIKHSKELTKIPILSSSYSSHIFQNAEWWGSLIGSGVASFVKKISKP
jgi:hypothetical protein